MCSRIVNHMINTLIPLFVSVLLFISACGGSSGVIVDDSDDPTEQNAELDAPEDNAGEGSDTDSPVPTDSDTESPDISQPEQPVNDDTPAILPPAPLNLRANRYSATAAEIFWEQPEGLSGQTVEYLVSLDGNELGRVSTSSFFTDSLQSGIAYNMSVSTVDSNGLVSLPLSIRISEQVDVPAPVYDFDLALEHTRASLEEGSDSGLRVVISVAPKGNEAVAIQVLGQSPSDSSDIVVELDRDTLQADEPNALLTLRMPVGMRPIQPQERRFNVIASSGEEVRIAELVVDISPVPAPDVYLLIGQSNMVGSSEEGAKQVWAGGLDERNGRIWQLNVAPNNTQIFAGLDDFRNESNTLIEPHFIEAEDPLHDPRNPIVTFKGGTTIGPGLSFAKAALADTTQRIYLVPAAWGASGFCRVAGEELAWNAGATDNESLGGTGLLERALTRLRITLRESGGILRGILWHQGGADSNDQACADAYAENLKLMVERIRREAAQDLRGEIARGSQAPIPFIAATQSRGSDDRGDFSLWPSTKYQVDAVHRSIDSLVPYADWVNNDDLVPPAYPCGSSSCVHFGATASRETGRRFYEALKRIWQR